MSKVGPVLNVVQNVKFTLVKATKSQREGVYVQPYCFCNLGNRWGWLFNATPRPLYPEEGDTVPTVKRAGWAPVRVWTNAENLAPNGIRSPDLPARSEQLYRLSYPGLHS
jgi:hypothetical protein